MKVYFVRHGQSKFNGRGIYQPPRVGLSSTGKLQARQVAAKLSCQPIGLILSSPHDRAKQTAQIIGKCLDKKVSYTYLLSEERRPSLVEGKKIKDEQSKKIRKLFFEKSDDHKWYFSDEENFSDLVGRAKRFIKYLLTKNKREIVVVSHSNFIKLLISVMMFEGEINSHVYKKFLIFFDSKNTGIAECSLKENGKWRLNAWNELSCAEKPRRKTAKTCQNIFMGV